MSSVQLLESYFSLSFLPAFYYCPKTTPGATGTPSILEFDPEQVPLYTNNPAKALVPLNTPLSQCITTTSQRSLEEHVSVLYKEYASKEEKSRPCRDGTPSHQTSTVGVSVNIPLLHIMPHGGLRASQQGFPVASHTLTDSTPNLPQKRALQTDGLDGEGSMSDLARLDENLVKILWTVRLIPLQQNSQDGTQTFILTLTQYSETEGAASSTRRASMQSPTVDQLKSSMRDSEHPYLSSPSPSLFQPLVPTSVPLDKDAANVINKDSFTLSTPSRPSPLGQSRPLEPLVDSPQSSSPDGTRQSASRLQVPKQLEARGKEFGFEFAEAFRQVDDGLQTDFANAHDVIMNTDKAQASNVAIAISGLSKLGNAKVLNRHRSRPSARVVADTTMSNLENLPVGACATLDPNILARCVENAPIGFVIATPHAKIVWVNETWYEITGVEKGDSLDSWIDRVAPDYVPLVMDVIGQLINKGTSMNLDFMWMDGRWANLTTQCDIDEDGEFHGYAGTLTDATDRKNAQLAEVDGLKTREANAKKGAEEAKLHSRQLAEANIRNQKLLQQRNMLAKMTEISPTGMAIILPTGALKWGNKAFHEMYDCENEEKVGWLSSVAEMDQPLLKEKWEFALTNRVPLWSRHQLKNGRTVIVESRPDLASSVDGIAPFISSTNDISAQVAGELEIQKLSDQRVADAEHRRREAIFQKEQQSLLVDVVSHELRNAINPILQSSLLIKASLNLARNALTVDSDSDGVPRSGKFDFGESLDEDIEACDAIIDSANQMERVANDVLGLAQIQLNQLEVTPVPFGLETQMKAIMRMFQADCRAKDLDFVVDLGQSLNMLGPGCMIKADPSRLQQMVVNLCSNAIKFTSRRDVRRVVVRVDVSLEEPGPTDPVVPPATQTSADSGPVQVNTPLFLYVSVRDTGPGMTSEELGKLFKRFTQANTEIHTQLGGNGLGLFIARQLSKLQNGRIEAVSTLGVGSDFRFYIAATAAGPKPPTPLKPKRVPADIGPPLRILVVDDNIINRKTLHRQLKVYNHSVVMSEDGKDALVSSRTRGRFRIMLTGAANF